MNTTFIGDGGVFGSKYMVDKRKKKALNEVENKQSKAKRRKVTSKNYKNSKDFYIKTTKSNKKKHVRRCEIIVEATPK